MIAVLLFVMQHAAALVLLLAVAAAAGTAVIGARASLALRATLGLAVAGQLFVLLGTFGVLRPWSLAAFALLALAGGAMRVQRIAIDWRTTMLFTLAAVPLFVLALYPPIAFDETLYHLPFIRSLAATGSIEFLPNVRFPIFPQLHELLGVPLYLALGDVAPHLVAVAELLLLASLLYGWTRDRHAGLLAAALLLGNPIVFQLGSVTYVECALMLFVAAGFYCLDRAALTRSAGVPPAGSQASRLREVAARRRLASRRGRRRSEQAWWYAARLESGTRSAGVPPAGSQASRLREVAARRRQASRRGRRRSEQAWWYAACLESGTRSAGVPPAGSQASRLREMAARRRQASRRGRRRSEQAWWYAACLESGTRSAGVPPAGSQASRLREMAARRRQASRRGRRRSEQQWWYAAAGFLLGTACSVKYLGWYFAAAAGVVLLFDANRRRAVPLFVAALLVAVAPMYARIIALSGNPLFPFATHVFGTSPWAMDVTELRLPWRLLWDITFARERVNQQPPYSPLFALSFIAALFAARKDRRAAIVGAICAGYLVAFAFLPKDSRYLLPLLPLVSLWSGAVTRRMTAVLATLSLLGGLAYVGFRIVRQGPPPLTAAARREHLQRRIPELRALEQRGPGAIYVCGAEQLHDFAGDDFRGDVVGPLANVRILDRSATSRELAAKLAQLDVRYFLASRRVCPQKWQELAAAPEFERVYADDGAVLWRVVGAPSISSR